MASAHSQSSHHSRDSAAGALVQKVKNSLDEMIRRMQKDTQYTPTREALEELAETLLNIINKHHLSILGAERYIKAAVIDLTEVPEMAPQMQRISFLTAMRDASKNLLSFIEG